MWQSIKLYTSPRLLAVLCLGFSSGLPLALVFSTLSVWLTEEGVSRTSIGLFAALTLPYTFKFVWSPFMDQIYLPVISNYFGRRRSWLLITQIALMVSIFSMGGLDPSRDVMMVALFAFLVSFLSASQDIVIDAFRIELLKDDEQGAGAAMSVFGYRIGMLVSSAGALLIAEYYSWDISYKVMALCVLVGVMTVLVTKPRIEALEDHFKQFKLRLWLYKAIAKPFIVFVQHEHWMLILLFVFLYKFGDALAGVMTNTFLIETGFSKVEIASVVKTLGFAAAILGSFLGGVLVYRLGVLKSLLICGILQMISNGMFIIQDMVGHDITVLAITIAVENGAGGMGTAAFVAYLSGLCNVRYTATQYALLSSLAAVGRTLLGASSGAFATFFGWSLFFAFSIIVALPGLYLLVYLMKQEKASASLIK